MSFITPPPCCSPSQNHGLCGPQCSSAARAKYGRPVAAAPRRQMTSLPRTTDGVNTWFSRYPVGIPASSIISTTRRASCKLRAKGFSQATPNNGVARFALPAAMASITAIRESLGELIQIASMLGSAAIASRSSNATAGPSFNSLA